MVATKGIEGVSWVAEFGGAAVLTQAMKILADQGVTLEDHTAFLYRPNTNVEEAAQAKALLILLKDIFPDYSINFDLEDCDRILRVESDSIDSNAIIRFLNTQNFQCEVLN